MTDKQNNHLDMFRAVTKLADNNTAIVNTVVTFMKGITALKSKVTAIETTSGQQAQALAARGVAGADALVAELAPLFDKKAVAEGQPVNP